MPSSKNYSMREMLLDQCLSTGKEYTREELMEAVNRELMKRRRSSIASRSTFMLDIQEMNNKFRNMYGVPGIVYRDCGRKRYYRYRNGIRSIYNRELTAEEIEKLQEVRSLMQGLRGMPRLEWLDQMSARFDQQMMSSQRIIASFEEGTTGDNLFFQQLFDAIAQKRVLTIVYQRFGQEPREHTISPYYLKQYWRRWYLFATIKDHDFVTCFSLDRILAVAKNDVEPYVESCVDFNHFFDDIVGVSHPVNGQVDHIVLRGDTWVEYYLRTLPVHPLQQLESLGADGCRVTLDVMINNELIQELAFYGDHLCVELPQQLRDVMAERAQKLADYYDPKVDFGDH